MKFLFKLLSDKPEFTPVELYHELNKDSSTLWSRRGHETIGLGKSFQKGTRSDQVKAAFMIDDEAKTASVKDIAALDKLADFFIAKSKGKTGKDHDRAGICLALICQQQGLSVLPAYANKLDQLYEKDTVVMPHVTSSKEARKAALQKLQQAGQQIAQKVTGTNPNPNLQPPPPTSSSSTMLPTRAASPKLDPKLTPGPRQPTQPTQPTPQSDPSLQSQAARTTKNKTPEPKPKDKNAIPDPAPQGRVEDTSKSKDQTAVDALLSALVDTEKATTGDVYAKKKAQQKTFEKEILTLEESQVRLLLEYMAKVPGMKAGEDKYFALVRQERINTWIGNGNTRTWQEMFKKAKLQLMDKLAEKVATKSDDGKKTVLSEKEYTETKKLLDIHTGHWAITRWGSTASSALFSRRFDQVKSAPVSAPPKPIAKSQP